MSTFDNPFDPRRQLTPSGCACGRHLSQVDHDRDAATQLQCAAVESEEKRYEGVVASAVMRAMFPQDAARRAFLKSVGASTALAAMSQFFPLKTATEVFAQAARSRRRTSRSDSSRSPAPRRSSWRKPMGFYEKHGLNVEVIKTAGWAVVRDKTINKEYDAAHMLSPMPLAITMGAGSNPIPYTMPAVENINGQAITLAIKHKDKRDPKDWKGMKFAVPFDYSMHNYLLRYYVAEHGIDPDQDIQIRAVPPPEMVANLRADNIDGFLAPDPVNQRAVYDGVGLHPHPVEGHLGPAPVLRLRGVQGIRHRIAEHLCGAAQGDHRRHRLCHQAGEPQADRRGDRAGQLPQPAGDRGRAGADRHLRRRPRQRARRCPDRIDFDPFPWQSFAVWIMTQMKRWGQVKGDIDYAGRRQAGLSRDRHRQADEGSSA